MKRSRARKNRIARGDVMAPTWIATSGNTSWTLHTNGQRCLSATSQPASPRVRGGDTAMTPSNGPRAVRPAMVARPVKPMNPSARAARFDLSVGNGWRRTTVAASWRPRRNGRPRQPSTIRWSAYQGSEVTTCTSWPSPPRWSTMADTTTPVGAVSGSRCGVMTRSRTIRPLIRSAVRTPVLLIRVPNRRGVSARRVPGQPPKPPRSGRQPP